METKPISTSVTKAISTHVPKPFIQGMVPTGLYITKQELSDTLTAQNNRLVDLIRSIHSTHQEQVSKLQSAHEQQVSSLIEVHTKELQSMRELIETMRVQYEQNTTRLVENMNAIITSHQNNIERLDNNIRNLVDINTRQPNDKVIVDRIHEVKTSIENQLDNVGADIVSAVRGPLDGQGVIKVLGTKRMTTEEASAMTVKELTDLMNKLCSMHKVYTNRQTNKPTQKRLQTINAMARNIEMMKEVRDNKKRNEHGIIPT